MDSKNISPHSGFSLIELMMVVGLIGIVMLGSMRMFQDAFKTQSKVEAGQDSILITDQLARILSDAPVCTELLKGTLSSNDSQIVMGRGLYKGATQGRIMISDLKIQDISELADDVYLGNIEIRGGYASGELGGQFARQLPIVFRTDKRNYIQECLGDNFGIAGNCKALGGVWNGQKQKCDLCPALGGELNARGRCQLAGTPIASCPMQKAFGANSATGMCGGTWDSDFIKDSISYLGSFGHISSETVGAYKASLLEALNNPPRTESPAKTTGSKNQVSWAISIEPMIEATAKPCSAIVYFTVKCP